MNFSKTKRLKVLTLESIPTFKHWCSNFFQLQTPFWQQYCLKSKSINIFTSSTMLCLHSQIINYTWLTLTWLWMLSLTNFEFSPNFWESSTNCVFLDFQISFFPVIWDQLPTFGWLNSKVSFYCSQHWFFCSQKLGDQYQASVLNSNNQSSHVNSCNLRPTPNYWMITLKSMLILLPTLLPLLPEIGRSIPGK